MNNRSAMHRRERTPWPRIPWPQGASLSASLSASWGLCWSAIGLAAACSGGEANPVNTNTTEAPPNPAFAAAPGGEAAPGGPGHAEVTGGEASNPVPGGAIQGADSQAGGGTTPAPATGGATPGDPGLEEACPTQALPHTPLRRLTRFEYGNTVRDLLGVNIDVASTLPVDEHTNGFSNNAAVLTVSALHAEKYVLASETLATAAVANLDSLAPCELGAETECAAEFAQDFGRRAFRRPLTPEDEQYLLAAFQLGYDGGSYAEGIEVMIRAALQSPHFLYRVEQGRPDAANPESLVRLTAFELATRLSYLLWASGPDDALLDAAARGELETRDQVAAKAREMLDDPRARPAIAEFFKQWLGTSRLDVTSKNQTLFPAYSSEVRTAMAQELPAFVEHVLWEGDHKFESLLTSPVAFVTPALAEIYGAEVADSTSGRPQAVELPGEQNRAGILTQAGFLSVQAHPDQTSPVLRGKFVRAKLMCDPPPPPPPDAEIQPPAADSAVTARDRFSAHADAGGSCFGCHQLMDPIGFAFEHFDAIGQYREQEGGETIDVSGEIVGAAGALAGEFVGVRELAGKLAQSTLVRDCVATQWFRYSSGRNEVAPDACSLGQLRGAFEASNGDLIELVVAMTQTDAFLHRASLTDEVTQ